MLMQPGADHLVQAATAALTKGLVAQAAELLAQAIRADPRHPMVLTKQAQLAVRSKDHKRALLLTDAALAIEPNFAPAWDQRAAACWLAGHQTEAVQAARQAVHIQPPNPDFRLRLAQFTAWTGRGAETRTVLKPLLAAEQHEPLHFAAAVSILGGLAIAEGRFDEADGYFDRALDLQPDLYVTRMQRGMNRLRLGHFRAGWADYAAREAIPELYPLNLPAVADKAWEGQALLGKTLLVIDDQGYGDAIQFFRYLPLLRDRGAAHLTWRTFPPLVRLLRDAAPYATVLDTLPDKARFDFQCNSTSLPRWFETGLTNIPTVVPYLHPPPNLKAATRPPVTGSSRTQPARAGQLMVGRSVVARPRVGLAWSGDALHTRDHLRSIPAHLFLSLANIPGFSFHSLQREVRPADLPALAARPEIGRTVEEAVDFADTAALVARLDLVITVDTAIVHLAGALGKPVWVLLHVAPDWRWQAQRPDSPWYPSARLFRVTASEYLAPDRPTPDEVAKDAGWLPVLARVSMALQTFAAG